MQGVTPLPRGQEAPGESVQLVEDLLDWREKFRSWVFRAEKAEIGELAVLIIELEEQLADELEFLGRAKRKVRELAE